MSDEMLRALEAAEHEAAMAFFRAGEACESAKDVSASQAGHEALWNAKQAWLAAVRATERHKAERETRARVLDEVEAKLTCVLSHSALPGCVVCAPDVGKIVDAIAALRGQTEEGHSE